MSENDILQEIRDDSIPIVLGKLKLDWPHSFIMYQSITSLLELWKKTPKQSQGLYSPGGCADCGTYVIITLYQKTTVVQAHCTNVDCHELLEAVAHTSRIPWQDSTVIFGAIHDRISFTLVNALNEVGHNLSHSHTRVFWCPPEVTEVPNIALPEDVYLEFLNETNVPDVNRNWRHMYAGSDILLRDWIKRYFGVGLFRRCDSKLLSFSMTNCSGGIYIMGTDPEARGKGYAPIVASTMTNEILRRGKMPFGTVIVGNKPAEKVFTKMKFEVAFGVGYLYDRDVVTE